MTGTKGSKIIRWVSISTLCIGLALIIGVFLLKDKSGDESETSLIESIPLEANLTISKVHQTATRDGVKDWSLDADTAQYFNERKQLVLNAIDMEFYLKDNRQVNLSADKGTLTTDTKDVVISGNIKLHSDQNRLKTEQLHYNHEDKILFGDVPVEITGQAFNLKADRMTYDLDENRIVFEGNVKGYFVEDLPGQFN